MHRLLVWKSNLNGFAETRYSIRDLEDMRDLIRSELRDRMLYIEARELDDRGETIDSRLRVSADDMTDEDFRWLTAASRDQVRGVRA